MGDIYWDQIVDRMSSHSDYFQQTFSMVPVWVYTPKDTTNVVKRGPATASPKITSAQPKASRESQASKDEESEEDDNPTTDTKVEIIPGFSNEITDNQELNRRFKERLASLRNKRKAPDELDNAEHARKRQKIDKKRQDKIEKRAKFPQKNNQKNQFSKSVDNKAQEERDNLKSIEFASFDMSSSSAPVPLYLQQRKKKPSNTVLLQQAQAQREKLLALEGTEEGKKLASDQAWDTMLKRAQGEKVKDDITKLKKTVKREKSQKKKSARDWATRIQAQKKSQSEQQQRRQRNIDTRKQQKKDKKMGKPRPGFEGKKRQFINKK